MFWRSHASKPAPLSARPGASPGTDLEARTQDIGRELLAAARVHRAAGGGSLWSEKLISWALADEGFKTELFRFVDVFPVLRTPEQIHAHLLEYLEQPGVTLPKGMGVALKAGGLLKGTLAGTVTSQITSMAERFIAGRNVADAVKVLASRWKEGIAFSVDLLGELCVSHAEAAAYRERYMTLVEELARLAAGWQANPVLERDHLGAVPRVNVSIKISAMDGHVSPVDAEGSLDRLTAALQPLLERANALGAFINFDMEHHALKELTIRLFRRCCERFDFEAGLALQAYLRSAEADARDLMDWARSRGRIVTVRLIKGAYWDYETIHAEMMNWASPVWERKAETDACFERVTGLLLEGMPREVGKGGIKLALGTHNVRSVAHAMAVLERADLPPAALEFQALRGMADDMKAALVERGWRVREYQPVGEMIPGMGYLVRRLLENTSNEGWLRVGASEEVTEEQLLASPHEAAGGRGEEPPEAPGAAEGTFLNEPWRDFSEAPAREAFAAALSQARVPRVEIAATADDAREAVARAQAAFPAWRDRAPEDRAAILQKAAAILRERRDAVSALVVKESHKPWVEADADVCEAIDFCAYYAREAVKLFAPERLGRFAGERNDYFHAPRGVAAVISPWNFPLAIPAGMVTAALVTGNTVVLKPAEQTPAIGRALCEVLWEAGVPRDVLQFLAGAGETVGAALVKDPRVSVIAFTGSKEVGLSIVRDAANTPPGQLFVKRVVCEMGGKNAMIIDASADLDEAVLGVRQSAFGYAGQKCSAGSRAIVLDSIHDAFVTRLVEATRALVLGDAADPATDVPPVIDDAAAAKIREYLEIGKSEATLVYPEASASSSSPSIRNLIVPHLFTDVRPEHRIAQEEIFGPVLAILRAKNFEEALALANDSVYKLTGGVYSRTPSHLERARREFRVGNLYLNRGITGALVGRQPFGGFGLSGVGAKAGGPHYLLQFTDPRAVTENTLRRGFAPMEGGGRVE
jgi:RHH-type proline utilization regulon transcriptional repressor/proline dehydrogenase/delta 1-pyrroline-5-carboxylate dehydrogenase